MAGRALLQPHLLEKSDHLLISLVLALPPQLQQCSSGRIVSCTPTGAVSLHSVKGSDRGSEQQQTLVVAAFAQAVFAVPASVSSTATVTMMSRWMGSAPVHTRKSWRRCCVAAESSRQWGAWWGISHSATLQRATGRFRPLGFWRSTWPRRVRHYDQAVTCQPALAWCASSLPTASQGGEQQSPPNLNNPCSGQHTQGLRPATPEARPHP